MTLFSSLEITSKQEWKTEKQTLSLMKPGKICNNKTKRIRNGCQLQLNLDRKMPKDMTADLRTDLLEYSSSKQMARPEGKTSHVQKQNQGTWLVVWTSLDKFYTKKASRQAE